MAAQRGDGRLDHRFGRRLIGIADREEDDLTAGRLLLRSLDMNLPRPGALAGNAINER